MITYCNEMIHLSFQAVELERGRVLEREREREREREQCTSNTY